MDQSLASIQAEFEQFLLDLTTVERKVIHALTDVARDVLASRPHGAPGVAGAITNRVVQAPVSLKLPTLYLLDSIVKLVGEPYTTYFAVRLPEAFAAAWWAGNGSLQRPLQKLYSTWSGVFPQPVLTDIAARITQPSPPAAAAPQQPTAPAATVPAATYYAPAIDVPTLQQPAYVYGTAAPQQPLLVQAQQPLQPMGVMAYGGGGLAVQDAAQPAVYMQQLPPGYGVVQQDYAAAPAQVVMMQPQPTQPLMAQPAEPPQPAQPPQQAPVNVADLMASLISAGILAAPTATPAAALASSPLRGSPHPAAAANGPSREGTPPAAAFPTRQEEELPMSAEFTPERIKSKNPGAVRRLLEQTELTKSRFLDRKFLRRQRRSGGQHISRLWYVEQQTWLASTTGVGPAAQEQQQQEAATAAAAVPPPEQCTVPVDDAQTHCALSGERFQQFWDEEHQEWRYRDAKRLDAEEAARYGLEEGAIVLVSALGTPGSADVLQPAAGVLSAMVAEQEIAEDLAAATAATEPAAGAEAGAGEEDEGKEDVKPAVKHEREGSPPGGEAQQEQKRLRVH